MAEKILIVSDSHGANDNLRRVVKNMAGTMSRMIFLGDAVCSPEVIVGIAGCPVDFVRGNCDSSLSGIPISKLIEIGEHKVLITHGHQYGVNMGTDTLRQAARENGADIAMFGHTHRPLIDTSSDVTLLNPGSVSQPRQEGREKTYLVMNIEEDGRTEYVLCHL